jgi:hypothetical protein
VNVQHPTCVWPGCRKRPEDAQLPICDHHARQVHARVEARTGEAQPARFPSPPPAADRRGVVYYLLLGDRVKVGFTTNLATRLRDYPPHAHLLATEPGVKVLEAQRHRELRHSLTGGREWFAHSDEVQSHIAAVLAEHGPPKVVQPRRSRQPASRVHYPVTVTHVDA